MVKTHSKIQPSNGDNIDKASKLIKSGKLVAFPTETVYGLGADATNDKAIASIYKAKERPQFNPLISHIADTKNIEEYVEWTSEAQKLSDIFWPGSLTMILKRKKDSPISLLASAGLDTIAIRCPDNEIALDLIKKSNCPIAAPSANASGTISPTKAIHVEESIGDNIDLILDGGACKIGIESTVLSLYNDRPTILRNGAITSEDLEKHITLFKQDLHDETSPKSPGMMLKHYAPKTPIRLNASNAKDDEAFLTFGNDTNYIGGKIRLNLSKKGSLTEAASNLFSMLRELDKENISSIAVMPIPKKELGIAINDKLKRAAV